MQVSCGRSVVSAARRPSICAGIVSPARFEIVGRSIESSPDDHFVVFAAYPNCCVGVSALRRVAAVVAGQASRAGWYRPPVFTPKELSSTPPQTIISLPVQTVVCCLRPDGALVVLVLAQVLVTGLYLPPVLKLKRPSPPQMITSTPV